jgi:hypothetical protein
MKKTPLLLVKITGVALLLAAAAVARAQTDFTVTEGPKGLTTTIPGAIITGTQDDWAVTLTGGVFWGIPTSLFLAEPENAAQMNILSFPTPLTMTWVSDVTANGLTGLPASITDTLLGPNGGPVATVEFTDLGDPSRQVPDGGMTSLLLTGAVGGLGWLRKYRR